MKRKESVTLTLRWVCFALLLTGLVFRLADRGDWTRVKALLPQTPTEEPTVTEEPLPTMYYEVIHKVPAEIPPAQPVSVYNTTGAELDLDALLHRPIAFDLSVEGPVILIVHTHATEAYADGYWDLGDHSTYDTTKNVVQVGQAMADRLNENGIPTLHDTTLNDVPGYNDAYERTAGVIAGYLEEYPTIQMVIDLHRDSITDEDGNELPMETTLNGEPAAQLLLVMGSNISGMDHPNWQENLSFALQLQSFCEGQAPGLFREMTLRSNRYNEHLTSHSILLEVGSAGNTLEEATRSALFFADQLTALLRGS